MRPDTLIFAHLFVQASQGQGDGHFDEVPESVVRDRTGGVEERRGGGRKDGGGGCVNLNTLARAPVLHHGEQQERNLGSHL